MSNINKGLKIGIIGLGQCGSNIANEFAKLGYKAIAINTSETDLAKLTHIPELNRCLVNSGGIHGAGKNPEIGKQAFLDNMDIIFELIEQVFMGQMEMYYICAGLGGGTGTGMCAVLADYLGKAEYNTGMILSFPADDESPKAKIVALAAFEEISKLPNIKSIFLLNNNKKEVGTSLIGIKGQYSMLNRNIVNRLDTLNIHSVMASEMAFDACDLLTVLNTRGMAGVFEVKIDDIKILTEDAALAQLVTRELADNIYLKQDFTKAKAAAFIFDLPKDGEGYLKPAALQQMKDELGTPFETFIGVYERPESENKGNIWVLLSGLPFPEDALKETEQFIKNIESSLITMFEERKTAKIEGAGNSLLSQFVTGKDQTPQTKPIRQGSLRSLAKK